MSSKIKLKATYGGYKEVAQYGLSEIGNIPYYQQMAAAAGAPPPELTQVQPPVEQTSQQGNNLLGKITNGIETGMDAYSAFIQGKRKIANQINNGIAIGAGVANIFDNIQLRRRENEQRIQSLQGTPYENSNRGLNNVPAYTKYGGSGKANVEAEQGEVFQNDGEVLKIDDTANTHEEGGVQIQAEKVLENTSSLRKDPMSKALKLDKTVVSDLSGFKAKRSMSHSDAYEFEAKKNSELQEKYMKNISKVVSNKVTDKYAIESAKLNVDLGLGQLPSENEIFDKYFDHQEQTKEEMGFYDNKLEAKYGKQVTYADGGVNPYKKGKTKTPTGLSSNYPGTQEGWNGYVDTWSDILGKKYDPDSYGGVYDLQYDAYNYTLENDPETVRNMWKTYGLNDKAKQAGLKYDTNNLSDEQLKELQPYYMDGLSGARTLQPKFDNNRISPVDPIAPPQVNTTLNKAPSLPTISGSTPPLVAQGSTQAPITNPVKQSEFNQPLEWYDTIGPASQILAGLRRDPELYNPVNIAQVELQQQDVRPALNNSQAEYNAATSNLSNDSIGAAQRAQIFSNKLRADNQVIGQYENANKQIQNQETQYNANARDRQEAANAQSRESFYTKVLQGRAKQEEQLLTGIDAMAKTFAENRAFNKNANLLMKLAPNFNEKGDFNGVPAKIVSGGSNQPGVVTNTNGQAVTNDKGQYLLRTRSKDGKVTEEYVDKSYYDKITGTASGKAIQNQMILNMLKKK